MASYTSVDMCIHRRFFVEKVRATTSCNREIVSFRSGVRARGVRHARSARKCGPSGSYFVFVCSGVVCCICWKDFIFGILVIVSPYQFSRVSPKRDDQEKCSSEFPKRDCQDTFPRKISKRCFQHVCTICFLVVSRKLSKQQP